MRFLAEGNLSVVIRREEQHVILQRYPASSIGSIPSGSAVRAFAVGEASVLGRGRPLRAWPLRLAGSFRGRRRAGRPVGVRVWSLMRRRRAQPVR